VTGVCEVYGRAVLVYWCDGIDEILSHKMTDSVPSAVRAGQLHDIVPHEHTKVPASTV
jgi:hypothetical protein